MRPPTDFTLTDQLRMTEREIRRRKEMLHITAEDSELLLNLKPQIASQLDILIEEFYAQQVQISEIARLIGDADTLRRLKQHMRLYILALFDSDYGHDYVLSRLRIGMVHKRIGVEPKLYVSAIRNLQNLLRTVILNNSNKDCSLCGKQVNALEKILLFDLQLVFDTYIHSLMDELSRGKEEIEQYAESLEETVAERTRELFDLARKDGLTGLLNQRSFYEELRRELARSQRHGQEMTLMYFDLDGFKKVNDTQGHNRGDAILSGVADAINQSIRAEDIPARYGGDEFCIILPQTDSVSGASIAKRLSAAFDKTMGDSGVTFSIGLATSKSETPLDGDTLVKKADSAMYKSKKISGHAITVADD
ncbi:MAG: GGDEF domain-containing protein [Desulfobulbaceae bacterium]|nr:GGDEF domain-containing protein [Desulfobulbaceae bacterium]